VVSIETSHSRDVPMSSRSRLGQNPQHLGLGPMRLRFRLTVDEVCLLIFGMSIHFRDIRSQNLKLPKIAPNLELGWVNICACILFAGKPKFTKFCCC